MDGAKHSAPGMQVAAARAAVIRAAVASVVAVAAALLVWSHRGKRLPVPLDIVGYPTWADFNFQPLFLEYRLVVWFVPVVATVVYLILRRFGPLAASRPAPARIPLVLSASQHAVPDDAWSPWTLLQRLAWLMPTGLVAAVGLDAAEQVPTLIDRRGVIVGLSCVVVVLVCALVLTVVLGWRRRPLTPFVRRYSENVVRVHAPAAVAVAVAAFASFVRHTRAMSRSGKIDDSWSWIPDWPLLLCGLFAVVAAVAVAVRLRDAVRVESWVVTYVLGGLVVFFATSTLPNPAGPLAGFDDMMSVTGGQLVADGAFPWRDISFIHGPFRDAFTSILGFHVFEHTLWGASAIGTAILNPLMVTGMYVLGVWASRRSLVAAVALVPAVVWVAAFAPVDARWIAMGWLFVALGVALSRPGIWWTVALASFSFADAVLVPEAAYEVMAVGAVLVASDVWHRSPGAPIWRCLQRTGIFAATGAALSCLLALYLQLNHALGAFFNYYLVFGPGHNAAGALPVGLASTHRDKLAMVSVAVIVVAAFAGAALTAFRRSAVSSRQWVLLASAIFAGLYGEKALGRFDSGHVNQSVVGAVPLGVVMLAMLLERVDQTAVGLARRIASGSVRGLPVRPMSAVVASLSVILLPGAADAVRASPVHNKVWVEDQRDPLVGYSTPGSVHRNVLADWRSVIDTLDTDHSGLFDLTNAAGFFYYLLGQESPTRYYHVSMAVPEIAQRQLVDELRAARPALVAFDAPVGLVAWDGPRNEVRHFIVSDYILDHWTPVVRVGGALFMLRDDLVASMPALPALHSDPTTTDLYTNSASCDWGQSADYLESTPSGASVPLAVQPPARMQITRFSGWAFDTVGHEPVRDVLIAVDGVVVTRVRANVFRGDVGTYLGEPSANLSGFQGAAVSASGSVTAFVQLIDGSIHPLGVANGLTQLVMSDGTPAPVAADPTSGSLDGLSSVHRSVSKLVAPSQTPVRDFDLLRLSSSQGTIGDADLLVTDSLTALQGGATIRAEVDPAAGTEFDLRVGSCLQWKGIAGDSFYLVQSGGRTIDQAVLSRRAR